MSVSSDMIRQRYLLRTLHEISKFLGKEAEYNQFEEYIQLARKEDRQPSTEEVANHAPSWIQILSPALIRLYDAGYTYGRADGLCAYRLGDTK